MKTLIFELTMPNVGSWNGRWSGEDDYYAVIRQVKDDKAQELLQKRSWYHGWSDGWGARVSVHLAALGEAKKAKKKSKGFCGYDWMIDNIIAFGQTREPDEVPV